MMSGMCKAWFDGKLAEAQRLHYAMEPLNRVMFIETNPVPVKTALHLMGKMGPELRLPLVKLMPENQAKLEAVLKEAKLI